MVTHPSTNWARRRLTSLIETNALPLHQTATIIRMLHFTSHYEYHLREMDIILFKIYRNLCVTIIMSV